MAVKDLVHFAVQKPDNDYVLVPRSLVEGLLGSLNLQPEIPGNFSPGEFLDEFERACKIDLRLRPLTITEHMRHAGRLLDFLKKHPLRATRPELRRFLELDPAINAIKTVRVLYGKFLSSDLASCFKVPQPVPRVIIAPTREQLLNTFQRLKTVEFRAAFLVVATSGLRRHELLELTPARIDLEKRMILPDNSSSRTKLQWVTFFNFEAKVALEELLIEKSPEPDERIFTFHKDTLTKKLERISATGFKITPQVLRDWFCNEMGRLGVQDRYIDAFCGRVPKRVLGRYYTDYSPERLREVYEKADLKVFGQDLIERAREREWR